MSNQPTLRTLFEVGRDNAARVFHEMGNVSPIWHAVPAQGDHLLIATPWRSDDEKRIAMEFLRDKFKELNVQRFVCVVEAWAVMGRNIDTVSGVRPSEHPDRREVVRVQAEDRDGSVLSGQYYILRPEHGPATLSQFHEDPGNMVMTGCMTGLLNITRH
jgi:hypothetical protein